MAPAAGEVSRAAAGRACPRAGRGRGPPGGAAWMLSRSIIPRGVKWNREMDRKLLAYYGEQEGRFRAGSGRRAGPPVLGQETRSCPTRPGDYSFSAVSGGGGVACSLGGAEAGGFGGGPSNEWCRGGYVRCPRLRT
jgi:hypothetical protein